MKANKPYFHYLTELSWHVCRTTQYARAGQSVHRRDQGLRSATGYKAGLL